MVGPATVDVSHDQWNAEPWMEMALSQRCCPKGQQDGSSSGGIKSSGDSRVKIPSPGPT